MTAAPPAGGRGLTKSSPPGGGARERMAAVSQPVPEHTVACFLIARRIVEAGLADTARRLLERRGFDVLERIDLSDVDRQRLAASDAVEDAVDDAVTDASDAGALLVALDLQPWPPGTRSPPVVGGWDDDRIAHLSFITEQLAALLGGATERGGGATTDDHHGLVRAVTPTPLAWSVLERLAPERTAGIGREIEARCRAFVPPFPVVRPLTELGNNARTDVVTFEGEPAVCKTFRPGRERFLANEVAGLRCASSIAEIPPILADGPSWVVLPYYHDLVDPRGRSGLLPLAVVKQIFAAMRRLHDLGYGHLDFAPAHVLHDRVQGPKIIDFDRLHAYGDDRPPFERSVTIVGHLDDYASEAPNGRPATYARVWYPQVGLAFESLQHDPTLLQHLKRIAYLLGRRGAALVRSAKRAPRRLARRRVEASCVR
jgi:hypothetical protein